MGNYERTLHRIDELEQRKKYLLNELTSMKNQLLTTRDKSQQSLIINLMDDRSEELQDTIVALGENYGYLRELEYIDGCEY